MIDFNKYSPAEVQAIIVNDQELKMQIIENMETFGGSFVKALAECMRRADKFNLAILADGFFAYMCEYQPKKWANYKGR